MCRRATSRALAVPTATSVAVLRGARDGRDPARAGLWPPAAAGQKRPAAAGQKRPAAAGQKL
jgi:hypothetical protein